MGLAVARPGYALGQLSEKVTTPLQGLVLVMLLAPWTHFFLSQKLERPEAHLKRKVNGTQTDFGGVVMGAVGTRLPSPHRSRRALLTHRAPPRVLASKR
jgi:hypothetical protein